MINVLREAPHEIAVKRIKVLGFYAVPPFVKSSFYWIEFFRCTPMNRCFLLAALGFVKKLTILIFLQIYTQHAFNISVFSV